MKNTDLSQQVMDKIKLQHIKMRSKFSIIAEKLGLESAFILIILIAVFLISLSLYIMKQNGVFEFLSFGRDGWLVMLENIPYDMILILVVLIIAGCAILKQFDVSYRKPFIYFILGLILAIAGLGIITMNFGFNELLFPSTKIAGEIEKMSSKNQAEQIMKPVYPKVMKVFLNKIQHRPISQQAIIGKIYKKDNEFVYLITPQGRKLIIKTADLSELFVQNAKQGDVIKAIGKIQDNNFAVIKIQKICSLCEKYFPVYGPLKN